MAEYVNDEDWSLRIAELVIDALVKAKLLPKTDFARAEGIAHEEILVRLIAGDRPEPRPKASN